VNQTKIVSWNVNGIRSVCRKGFPEILEKMNPDVLCLQEIKADLADVPSIAKDYFAYWLPSKRKGYSGVGILSKQEPLEVLSFPEMSKFAEDGRMLAVRFPKCTLFSLYFPNGGRDKEMMPFKFDMYGTFLNLLRKQEGGIVLCGDFNVAHTAMDLARPRENANNTMFTPEERSQLDQLVSAGFVDTFRHMNPEQKKYSWWLYSANSRERDIGWRIDYVFVSKELTKNVKEAFIISDIQGSDHCPVGAVIE